VECPRVSYVPGETTNGTEIDLTLSQSNPTAFIYTSGTVPLLASRYGKNDRDRVFYINVKGNRNIFTAAQRHGVKAFIWTGSLTAGPDDLRFQYPNIDETWPTSIHSLVYGESKARVSFILDNETTE